MGHGEDRRPGELERLVRRLDRPDSDAALQSIDPVTSRKKRSGYVGALRQRIDQPGEATPNQSQSQRPPELPAARSSNTTAVVIGATTAAIVASGFAVLFMSGTRPAGPPADVQVATPERLPSFGVGQLVAQDTLTPRDASWLVDRAVYLIEKGNLEGARMLLERASGLGSGPAALALGETYDPGRIADFARIGAKADARIARVWYERALALGVADARQRLAQLER